MAHAKKGPFLLFLCVRLQGASQTFYPEGLIPRRIPLVVISTIEKQSQKNKHLIGFRYYVIQNTSIWLVSLFCHPIHKHLIGFAISISQRSRNEIIQLPGEEKYFAEKHSKILLRMRSTFSCDIFRNSLVVELGLESIAWFPLA
jgi:hypothetical protein